MRIAHCKDAARANPQLGLLDAKNSIFACSERFQEAEKSNDMM
jgi:hypothetical protein